MTFPLKSLTLAAMIPATGLADTTIALPDPGFAPEGITADSSGMLYTGSLRQGRLIKIDPTTGTVADFAPAGANGMVSTVGVHAAGDLIFACSSDPGIGLRTGTAAPALVAFERGTGDAAGRYELPEGGGFCNDITELPDGTILATDSFTPRIYALPPGATQLEVWLDAPQLAAEGINLNGIAYDEGAVYVVRYDAGTVHRIAVTPKGGAGMVEDLPLPSVVHGADGLTALGGGRFLLVEGGGLNAGARGALLGLKVAQGAVSVDMIATDLNVPTTATVIGDTAYVVEGQLDHLFDPAAGPADPYRILAIALPDAYR